MRNIWIRVTLAVASAFVVFGQASAQSVSFWYNSLGDTATNQPPVINVFTGTDVTLSAYLKTTGGIGPLTGITCLFGYSTATTTGATATPSNTNATLVSFAWTQADLTNANNPQGSGGGGGVASGTSRPYGLWAVALSGGGNFAGTADNANFHFMDVTLHINAPIGTDIPINLWTAPPIDVWTSGVVNGSPNFTQFFPQSPYTGTLHVVPEPGSLAALGLGAIALIRRRRRSA